MQCRQPDTLQDIADAAADIGTREPAHLEPEGDVLLDGQMREQRIVLKHHAAVAPLGRHRGHVLIAKADAALARILEAGDHP